LIHEITRNFTNRYLLFRADDRKANIIPNGSAMLMRGKSLTCRPHATERGRSMTAEMPVEDRTQKSKHLTASRRLAAHQHG